MRRCWRRLVAWTGDSGRFLVDRPARLATVGVSLLLGFAVGAPLSDAGYDYTWRDPRFCGTCHVHDYANEAYFRSVHAGVTTCHDCHKVPLLHYPAEAWRMLTGPPEGPEEVGPTHVPSVLCGACHLADSQEELIGPMTRDFRDRVVKVDGSPLHRVHLQAERRDPGAYLGAGHPATERLTEAPHGLARETGAITCLDCHGSGGDLASHRFTASRDNCVACHARIAVAVGRLKALRCQECHLGGFVGTR